MRLVKKKSFTNSLQLPFYQNSSRENTSSKKKISSCLKKYSLTNNVQLSKVIVKIYKISKLQQ